MTLKKLRETVLAFRCGLLGKRSSEGMCFALCLPLQVYLSAKGVETRMVMGWALPHEPHYWLALPSGKIIDPTADQFGWANVWVGKKPKEYQEKESWDLVLKQ